MTGKMIEGISLNGGAEFVVTEDNYPNVFEALDLIASAEAMDGYDTYSVNMKYEPYLKTFEAWFGELEDNDLMEILMSKPNETKDLVLRHGFTELLSTFILEFKDELP